MADNFNLTLFTVGLNYTHYSDTLLQPGPYTVLAPTDAAFQAAGYPDAVSVIGAGPILKPLISYHILGGTYRLNQLPFQFNQEVKTLNGNLMYVTHWVRGNDTVLTINGATVISYNVAASNGLVQVINQVLSPAVYGDVQTAIAADPALTYFNAALLRTGMSDLLKGKGPFTLFAPTNNAFVALGFPTTDSINKTDVGVLKAILSYHIVSGRRFINDYILTAGSGNTGQQAMSDGNNVAFQLVPDYSNPGSFTGITLTGSGNTVPANLVRQNVLAGNGVLHTIDEVLKSTF